MQNRRQKRSVDWGLERQFTKVIIKILSQVYQGMLQCLKKGFIQNIGTISGLPNVLFIAERCRKLLKN